MLLTHCFNIDTILMSYIIYQSKRPKRPFSLILWPHSAAIYLCTFTEAGPFAQYFNLSWSIFTSMYWYFYISEGFEFFFHHCLFHLLEKNSRGHPVSWSKSPAVQGLQIYSNALNCLGLLPVLILFLLLDSTNLIRAYCEIERKRRLINSSLDATRSMLPLSVVWWPI